MPDNHPKYRLGLQPRKNGDRRLHLVDYMDFKAVPPPPPARMWLPPINYGVMLNDQIGDCTCAALGHAIQVWTYDATGVAATVPDQFILDMYKVIGHYVPGDPSTDNGATLEDALSFLRINGLAGHRDVAYAYVPQYNHNLVKAAVNIFGICDIALALPISAQAQVGGIWDVPPGGPVGPGQAGSWGGHSVALGGYDNTFLYVVTWGAIQKMTWKFWDNYVSECFPILSLEWLKKSGKTPGNLNIAQLRADLAAI